MTDNKTGGPAFPTVEYAGESDTAKWLLPRGGMTLRDWFAGKALAGMYLSAMHDKGPKFTAEEYAKWAYGAADAMLAERDK